MYNKGIGRFYENTFKEYVSLLIIRKMHLIR